MNVELNKIPTVDIKKYIDIKAKKTDVVKRQMYDEAAKLRDEERTLEVKYPILSEVKAKYTGKSRIDGSPMFIIDISQVRGIIIDDILKT